MTLDDPKSGAGRTGLIPVLSLALYLSTTAAVGQSAKDRGRQVFMEKGCPQCHSMHGVGGLKGPRLDDVGRRIGKSAIERQIVSGGLAMPSFRDVLSPKELHDVVEFLHKAKERLAPIQSP